MGRVDKLNAERQANITGETMTHFKQIGRSVELGESSITLEDANRLRRLATEAIPRISHLAIDESNAGTQIKTSLQVSNHIAGDIFGSEAVPCVQAYGKTRYFSEPDMWHSILYLTKYRDKNRDVKVDVRFETEVVGEEVMQSKRIVYVRRDIQGSTVFDGEQVKYVRHSRDYKKFERSIELEDIVDLEQRLGQLAARAAVTN